MKTRVGRPQCPILRFCKRLIYESGSCQPGNRNVSGSPLTLCTGGASPLISAAGLVLLRTCVGAVSRQAEFSRFPNGSDVAERGIEIIQRRDELDAVRKSFEVRSARTSEP